MLFLKEADTRIYRGRDLAREEELKGFPSPICGVLTKNCLPSDSLGKENGRPCVFSRP